jgi:hypothetical protein
MFESELGEVCARSRYARRVMPVKGRVNFVGVNSIRYSAWKRPFVAGCELSASTKGLRKLGDWASILPDRPLALDVAIRALQDRSKG